MIEILDLDAIDWSAQTDARGPATEMPALLSALRSDADYGAALDAVVDRASHQGCLAPCAPCVAPFLAELEGARPATVRTIEGPLASVESDPLVAAFAGHLPAPHAGIEVEGAITTAPTDSRSSPSRRPPSR